jgi:hypothetical protein
MNDIQKMIVDLKKAIEDNKQQKEINIGLIQIIETLLSPTIKNNYEIKKNSPTIFEYLKAKKVTHNSDIILNIAYYNEKFNGMTSFSADDIKNQYETARLKPPQNINDFIAKLEKNRGLLIECKEKKDGKKTWQLSSAGLNYVESSDIR